MSKTSPASKSPKSASTKKSFWISSPFLLTVATLLCLAGTICLFKTTSIPPGPSSYQLFLIGAGVLGLGLGVVWLWSIPDEGKEVALLRGKNMQAGVLAGATLFIILF